MKKTVLLAALAALAAVPLWAHADLASQRKAVIDNTFSAMDTNRDGRVTKAEYTKFANARFDQQAKTIDDAVTALDTNKDGKISKEEAAVVPEIARYFDGLDADKDGFLSRDEMQQAMVAAQNAELAAK